MTNKAKLMGRIVAASFSQRSLAEKMGVSKNTLNLKINGKRPFDTVEIETICKILHITDPMEKIDIFLAQTSHMWDDTDKSA